jgi:hypothetical protein
LDDLTLLTVYYIRKASVYPTVERPSYTALHFHAYAK